MILKIEKEINNINNTLDSLKEVHTSLVDGRFNFFGTLVEKIEKVECV